MTPSPQQATLSGNAKVSRHAPGKFYAVKNGTHPGVYRSWDECLEQVRGFKGASFKSFPTLSDAESFVAGTSSGSASDLKTAKFYAVKEGRVPGIYTDWPSAQKQIAGWKKPTFKSFLTRAEAQAFINPGARQARCYTQNAGLEFVDNGSNPPPKRRRTSYVQDDDAQNKIRSVDHLGKGCAHLCENREHNSQAIHNSPHTIFADSDRVTVELSNQPSAKTDVGSSILRIYTDGSSLGNGQKGACAGIGVYFGPDDPRNVSEPLHGDRQTNQRAELSAVMKALDVASNGQHVVIVTDSRYAMDCLTDWHKRWLQNGWRTRQGRPVENRDLIEEILQKIEKRDVTGSRTAFEWTKGHASVPGNVAADKLANNAAQIQRTAENSK